MPHMLKPGELKQIHPRRRLRSYVAASPFDIAEQNEITDADTGNVVPCGSYFWGALLRIDVYEAPEDVRFVFFGTGVMQVYACCLLHADDVVALDDSTGALPAAPAPVAHLARRTCITCPFGRISMCSGSPVQRAQSPKK